MKKIIWQLIFFIDLLIHLISTQLQHETIAAITKPVLLISLILLFITEGNNKESNITRIVITAQLLSLAGDVFLIFEHNHPVFFIYGLVCFLLAHIFFIVVFNRIRKENKTIVEWWVTIFVAGFYGLLVWFLFPHLGEMKIPVLIYGLVISVMLFSALQLLFVRNNKLLLITTGAILFVLSDSLLAINKFYAPFFCAGIMVMLTYAIAQFTIIQGLLNYTKVKKIELK